MPKVSICLTTYNRGSVLSLTIDSILAQSFTDFELIISDDCSTDETGKICKKYEQKDIRVKYYCNESNLKMPGNLNAAIKRASGKYIANLHDGDVYRADLIEKWLKVIRMDDEVLFVFNQYESLDENGKPVCIFDHKLNEVNDGIVIREYFYRTLSSAPWGTVLARKDAYERFGYFDAQYGFISDVEMWMRLSTKGKVGYVSEPLIQLTPREKNHKYFLPEATLFYLNLLILYRYYQKEELQEKPDRLVLIKKIKKQIRQSFFILAKYKDFKRLREFNYLLIQSKGFKLLSYMLPFLVLGVGKIEKIDILLWKSICEMKNRN